MATVKVPCGMICGYLVTFLFAFVALVYRVDFLVVTLCFWVAGPIVGIAFTAVLTRGEPAGQESADLRLARANKRQV